MINFFGGRNRKSMADAVKECGENPSVCLVDVRSPEEYRGGHVPGALNLPLDNLHAAAGLLPDKNAQLYLYCLSGARSAMATHRLRRMGYANCTNVGGIGAYSGKLEK